MSTSSLPDRKAASNPAPASGVQSVNRALDVLEFIGSKHPDVPIGEIATSLRLPLPTVHRLLATLSERGYTRQLPSRRYSLGFRILPLAESARALIGPVAERVLLDLVDETGETANLAVLAGDQAEYVAQAPSRHHMRMFTEIGQRVDLHSTGVGKALLSQLDSAHVDDLLDRRGLPGRTEHTITSRVRLHAELERIRSAGFAIDEQEQELGVRCVAVPIAGLSSGMAVSVSGPVTRMSESLVESVVPLLQSAARALAGSLERSD
jgi:IclR family acetate operon transcriptional repressor